MKPYYELCHHTLDLKLKTKGNLISKLSLSCQDQYVQGGYILVEWSLKTASLNIIVHDMLNLLYYEHWADKQRKFYIYLN